MSMDIKRISNIETPVSSNPTRSIEKGNGPGFEQTLRDIQNVSQPQAKGALGSPAMGELKFSNHAIDRMQSRGIRFSKEDLSRLSDAVGRAAQKGSKDSLILMDNSALIVSVKNNTVVTVMDKAALKENVFTNIDSTIVM